MTDETRKVVVAIDGPAGAGKSTVTKALTRRLGYQLLDTGALYRSVAYAARAAGIAWDDEAALAEVAASLEVRFSLEGETNRVFLGESEVTSEIRTPEVSEGASQVSALPMVRAALLALQRSLGGDGGVIAEGRDVGTVVFPDAGAKFFLTASAEVRAQRRVAELQESGHEAIDFASTLADLLKRDERDSTRATAPLVQAQDAVLLDSTDRSIDEIVEEMVAHVRHAERATP